MTNSTPPTFQHPQPCERQCDECLSLALEFALRPIAELLAARRLERCTITLRRTPPANDS